MVIKIFYFVIALFSVVMTLIVFQSPYSSFISKAGVDIADMQMNMIRDYDINESGINAYYEASSWIKNGESSNFYDFKGEILRENNRHRISSKMGIENGDEIIFKNDALYKNDDNLTFFSQEIIYNMKNNTIRSNVPFELKQNSRTATGKEVIYNTKTKQTYAKNVKAKLN